MLGISGEGIVKQRISYHSKQKEEQSSHQEGLGQDDTSKNTCPATHFLQPGPTFQSRGQKGGQRTLHLPSISMSGAWCAFSVPGPTCSQLCLPCYIEREMRMPEWPLCVLFTVWLSQGDGKSAEPQLSKLSGCGAVTWACGSFIWLMVGSYSPM